MHHIANNLLHKTPQTAQILLFSKIHYCNDGITKYVIDL